VLPSRSFRRRPRSSSLRRSVGRPLAPAGYMRSYVAPRDRERPPSLRLRSSSLVLAENFAIGCATARVPTAVPKSPPMGSAPVMPQLRATAPICANTERGLTILTDGQPSVCIVLKELFRVCRVGSGRPNYLRERR
jgi:hypothetical protein